MAKSHRTQSAPPSKPSPDFPLFPHKAGVWAKKIRGKLYYFGGWADDRGGTRALAMYNEQKDALHSGKKPREAAAGAATIKELVNQFLNFKQSRVDSGELTLRSWQGYKTGCDLLVSHFGKGRLLADLDPDDFTALRKKMSARWGPLCVANLITRIRVAFKYGYDIGLIDRPAHYGPGFKRPSTKTLRLHKATQGAKLFTAEQIRRMIDAAGVPLKAMILLGINCGFGNADCGKLPLSAVDLDNAMIDFPRPKTGLPRRCPLWPETVAAIREALAKRPRPKDKADAGLVFITRCGRSWFKDSPGSPVANETTELLHRLGLTVRRGVGFYALRHTFRTVADEARDQPAADHIMGHLVPHMSSVYRETISDARLRAVADHVRGWLWKE